MRSREKAFIIIVAAAAIGLLLMDDRDWRMVGEILAEAKSASIKYEPAKA